MGDKDKILDAIDKVNSLLSFKMADLVNKAVKAGRYVDVFEEEENNGESPTTGQVERDWLPQLA